jgi:sugar phosphate isomerase/epimerase
MPVRISAFPKCYLEDIVANRLPLFDWIEQAKQLDADGLEMYEGFLASLDDSYLDEVAQRIHDAGFDMPMLCCSPDFTTRDTEVRKRNVEHQCEMVRVCRKLGGKRSVCRVLSGQRYPDVSWEEGRDWVVESINEVLPVAREYDVVLGMENHYKDGFWRYPEFAQKADRFLAIVQSVADREHFGVQFDPSNAFLAGDDPVALLRQVADRVVSMHASDRYLKGGATLADLQSADDRTGYASILAHGVTGQGLNDYPTIFQILADHNYTGWISIEDGMNGMGEMADSLRFLREMCAQFRI